jgi:hypothetical protein
MAKTAASSSIPWHPAFVQAIKLELEPYRDRLEFIPNTASPPNLWKSTWLSSKRT